MRRKPPKNNPTKKQIRDWTVHLLTNIDYECMSECVKMFSTLEFLQNTPGKQKALHSNSTSGWIG